MTLTSTGVGSNSPSMKELLSAAVASNLALQAELQRRLACTKAAQVRNRRDSARVAASLSRRGYEDDGRDAATEKDGCSQKAAGVTPGCATRRASKRKSRNPNRRETRGFFIDRDGSTPALSWSEIASKNGKERNPLTASTSTARVIFERKKSRTSRKQPQKTWEQSKMENWPTSSCVEVTLRIENSAPMPADEGHEVHFTFATSNISKAKFTKQESLSLVSATSNSGGDVDWHDVATKHFAKFKRQTPWLCFSRCRSSVHNPAARCPPWSPDEDELLLKYIAAQGPQYLHQGEALTQICRNLYPRRNTKQLAVRAQATLVNPNYAQHAWSTEERRKLALLMRAYGRESTPIQCAAHRAHFPRRAPKSVAEKWVKTPGPVTLRQPCAAGRAGYAAQEPNEHAAPASALEPPAGDNDASTGNVREGHPGPGRACENRLAVWKPGAKRRSHGDGGTGGGGAPPSGHKRRGDPPSTSSKRKPKRETCALA